MCLHVYLWFYAILRSFPTPDLPPDNYSSGPHHPTRLSGSMPSGQKNLLPCLSGIINDYTPVLGFGCDSSSLEVGALNGFSAGDKVLLIQMQATQVDLSNTASFGTLLNTTCVGNYEFNRILSLGANTVQLKYTLSRPYDVSGKVQLIRVPEFDSARVCGLTCLPWNGSVGGVLALDVKNQLILSGDIDVSGKGFRGGIVEENIIPWVFGEQQYYYPPESTLAAQKGEGIVFIPADHSYGRGRAGNGGGGGNAHNGGGGGGANAGAGGNGGLEISNLPASPTPNTNGIGGDRYFDTDPAKVLMGGGGGGGHANDAKGSAGGAGGGIIFIHANTLSSNNFKLSANGIDVFGGQEQNDGQGGGGGGGSLILNITQNAGALFCEAKGGRGGSNPYTPDFQIHGPGGGGGGGKILLTQNLPGLAASLQGGINGLTSQGLTNGAGPGYNGKILTGITLQESAVPAHPVSPLMLLEALSPTCTDLSDGRIAVLHSSALAFRLNAGPWQPDSIFSNLTPGTYQIGLLFSGGCTLDTMAVVDAAVAVMDSLLYRNDADCQNGGSISVEAVSGIAPFQFQLNNGVWQSGGMFDQLPPGAYTLTMQDAAGCSISGNYTIGSPPPASDSLISSVDATCLTGGSLALEALTGTSPFEFSLNGGAWQSGGTFFDLAPGNYSVTMRDAAGCTLTENYSISAPPLAADTLLTLVHATCITGGTIGVMPQSGTPPFEFQLDAGLWQSGGTFTDLPAGNYSVGMRDAAGCILQKDYEILTPPNATLSLLSLLQASCIAGGELSVEALSGTPAFEFQLNNGAWQSTGVFSDLAPGSYTVAMRDGAGCTADASYTIAPPVALKDSLLLLQNATCVAGGDLILQALSGTAPFEFQINGGNWQPDGVFQGLVPGNYEVVIRDGAGCTLHENYSIAPPPELKDSLVAINHATCVDGGSIICQAVSGSAPFEFLLNGGNWQGAGNFTDLNAGVYSVTLRDAAGCITTDIFTVDQPPAAQDTLLLLTAATCIDGGSVAVQPVSGTAPFEFQLNGGGWQNTGLFSDLSAGSYSLVMRDGAGCTASSGFTLAAPPVPTLLLRAVSDATCVTGGEIDVLAISGTAPFLYQLNGSTSQITGLFTALPPGSYTLTLLDAAGCIQQAEYLIHPPPPAVDSLRSLSDPGCQDSGSVVFEALDGTPPFQFRLDNGPWQGTGLFDELQSGAYQVTMKDAAGCTDVDLFQIAPYTPLSISLDSSGIVDCRHAEGFLAVSAQGGVGGFRFSLNGPAALQENGYFQALPPGIYSIRVVDSSGCEAVLNDLPVPDEIDSALTHQTVVIYEGAYYEFPDGSTSARSGQYPFHFQTLEGCDSLHIIDLFVLKRHVYVPNIFSPDGDGLNDIFTVYSDASLDNIDLLRVYDRWGELIFEKQNFAPNEAAGEGWDGRFRGRTVNPGMFVWMAQLTFVDGLKRTLSGDVTVIR